MSWQPKARLEKLQYPWLEVSGVELAILRLDAIDPLISGNKWYKLRPHLLAARAAGSRYIASVGGAHSNHLHALAAAGKRFGFNSVGLLRGHEQDTPTVRDLQTMGMQLHWLGYEGYRQRHQPNFWLRWQNRYADLYPIDEGGLSLLSAQGCAVLVDAVRAQLASIGWTDYHGWWLGVGTGTTLAGLRIAEDAHREVYGALAVPADHGPAEQVSRLLREAGMPDQGYCLVEASRQGFARIDAELLSFMQESERSGRFFFEPVYTAKALLALRNQVSNGYLRGGTRLVFVHTGGLQGRRALPVSA